MKLERGKISSSQLTFLIIGVIMPLSATGTAAKHDAWLANLAGLIEGLIFSYIIVTLFMRFPGKTLVEFNDIIYGPYLGKVISSGYLWFILHATSIMLRNYSDFFTSVIYQETPMELLVILITLISVSAVRNGIEVIARCGVILVFIIFMTESITIILLLKDIEVTNLLPIFDLPLKNFIKASHNSSMLNYSLILPFQMILPFLNNIKQVKASTMKGLIFAGIFIIIISVRNISVLGVTAAIEAFPTYQTIRLINIANISRLEILVTFYLLSLGFLKFSVFLYATVLSIAQLLKLHSYLPLVFPVGTIVVTLSILLFDSIIEYRHFMSDIAPYYAILFTFGIPLLSLIIAMIRGLPKSSKRELKC